MTASFHISSLVVTADPKRLSRVKAAISRLKYAEIAIADSSGKLVVTLETQSEQALVQGLTDIQFIPGVASAALCYHHSEVTEAASDADEHRKAVS
jgi:nitrate reductase NapD